MTQLPDPSWEGVLVYGHQKGMQFGHDLVFTYGPLGFLSITSFSPAVAVTRIFFEVALSLFIATGLGLLMVRMTWPWRLLLLAFFVIVTEPPHWGGSALYIDLGLFAWGLICFFEQRPRLHFFVAVLVALAAAGALVKFTFLVIGVFTVGLLACDLILRGRPALAIGMVAGVVLAFLLSWWLLGQNLSGLGAFLSGSWAVAQGYSLAMGVDSGGKALMLVVLMVATTLAAAAIRCVSMPVAEPGWTGARRGVLLIWIAGLLFLNWKYMSVRMDFEHLRLLFGFIPLVAVCLEAIPTIAPRTTLRSRVATLFCLLAAVVLAQTQIHHNYFPFFGIKQACRDLSWNFGVMLRPTRYLHEKTEVFCEEQTKEQLPQVRSAVGRATVDVFGQNQAYALANDLNFHPRPVFQSYSTYSRQLMELNERFYLSQDAPEYVLFHLDPIDGRFPPLEDALVFRHLVVNYQYLLTEGDVLLLQRRATTKVSLALLKEGTVHFGEKIDLRAWRDTNLWLEIDLQPTFAGQLQSLACKPQDTRLIVQDPANPTATRTFTAPAAMLSAGFVASPMLLTDRDLQKFYTGGNAIRPDWYVIQPPESQPSVSAWQPEIHFRLFRIEVKSPR